MWLMCITWQGNEDAVIHSVIESEENKKKEKKTKKSKTGLSNL